MAFLQGEYPDYPIDILRHNHAQVHQRLVFIRDDRQDPSTYGGRVCRAMSVPSWRE